MKTGFYDVVWYWKRGWHKAQPSGLDIQGRLDELRNAGHYALPGRLSIGPPSDAPLQSRVDEMLDWRKQRDRINAETPEQRNMGIMTTIYGCMGL